MNGRSRPREGGSEKTIAAVNTILAPTAADIALPQITDNTPEVDAALALAAAGIYVFPVDHPELSICAGVGKHHDPFDGPDHQRGKHPCVAFSEKATTKEQVIRAHWSQGPRNIGINCGKSGLVVVDEDKLGAFKRYADEHGVKIPRTLVVATAKGRHYYFLAREDHPLGNKEGASATTASTFAQATAMSSVPAPFIKPALCTASKFQSQLCPFLIGLSPESEQGRSQNWATSK